MDNNSLFLKSSVFGGFRKKEVLSYIFELNESTQEAQQRFAEQIDEMSRSHDELLRSSAELESRLEALQKKSDETELLLEEESKKNRASLETIDRLNAELKRQGGELAKKTDDVSRFAAMNAELADKNRVLEEKRSQVELAASQIANILGKARCDAERVADEAREEAARIILEAQNKADALTAHAKTMAERHVQEANRQARDLYDKFSEFRDGLDKMRADVTEAAYDIIEKTEVISATLSKSAAAIPEDVLPPEEAPKGTAPQAALTYELENDSQPFAASSAPSRQDTEISGLASEILGRYGVRKDDSGFFRLAIEK